MLIARVREWYQLAKDWRAAGFFETEHHRQMARAVRAGLGSGRLIVVTGPAGVGKTAFVRRLQGEIASEKKVAVAESLSVDTAGTTAPSLIAALIYDLSDDKDPKIPVQTEERMRRLQQLIAYRNKPVALFVDEAHDLTDETVMGVMRLINDIGGDRLSVVLIGQSKLRDRLPRLVMKEAGHRVDMLAFKGIDEDARSFLDWLVKSCALEDVDIDALIEPSALDLIATRSSKPFQFAESLDRAFEEGFRLGQKPISPAIVASTLERIDI